MYNTAIGNQTLFNNIYGFWNTAIGYQALYSNTLGTQNTAIGYKTLYYSNYLNEEPASANTATGYLSLENNQGSENTASGANSLISNTEGGQNTATGYNALYSNTTGYNNTAIGYYSLNSNCYGNYNIGIGSNANVNSSNLNNAIVIGNNALATADNSLVIGNTSTWANSITGIYPANMYVNPSTGQIMRSSMSTISGTGSPTCVAFWNTNNTLSSYGNFYWDNTNHRLGIGTTSPGQQLDITQNFNIPTTTSTTGIIYKGTNTFVHNYGTGNTFVGINSGNLTTTGGYNSGYGAQTLYLNTSGVQNTAIGSQSLAYNSSGSYNTASGYQALFSNTTGSLNTATGYLALYGNTTGGNNTAYGISALYSNTTGSYNTGIGNNVDVISGNLSNVTVIGNNAIANGNDQVILGNTAVQSLFCTGAYNATNSNNPNLYVNNSGQIMRSTSSTISGTGTPGQVAFWSTSSILTGDVALNYDNSHAILAIGQAPSSSYNDGKIYKNGDLFIHTSNYDQVISQYNNTFVGNKSGYNLESNSYGDPSHQYGAMLTGFGYNTLFNNTLGEENTGIGYISLRSNTTGSQNTGYGASSLNNNTTGGCNTGIGEDALADNQTGSRNTACGSASINSNITGGDNTAIGYLSLSSNTTGSSNTAIGSDANVSANNLSNATALGYGAIATGNNQIMLGNTSITSLYCMGATATTSNGANMYVDPTSGQIMRSTSSIRYKENVTDLTINTSGIYDLKPVSYTSKIDHEQYFGLIAEDVAKLLPQLVEYTKAKYVIPGSKSDELIPDAVRYPMLSVLMLNEMKKIKQQINKNDCNFIDLKQQIDKLKEENLQLKEKFEKDNQKLKVEIEQIKILLKKRNSKI